MRQTKGSVSLFLPKSPRQQQKEEHQPLGGRMRRIDLSYSIYALSHGCSRAQVEEALRSRCLDHKGTEKRQAEYVERTIRKASRLLDERGFIRGRER
jgi:hypothetical protein